MDLIRKVKISIINLNIFDKYSRDLFKIYRGRIATWLYIVLLAIAICILIIYTSISVQTVSDRIEAPSQEHYEKLQQQYPTTIRCPCTAVSIPNQEFIQITPMYHQLCGSDFVQLWWYNSLLVSDSEYVPANFMNYATTYFRTLAMFCNIANVTVANAMNQFYSTMYVNAQVMPRTLFVLETNAIIDTFLNMTLAEFTNSFSLVNEILHANQYMSGILTNGIPRIINISSYAAFTEYPWRIIWGTQIGMNENGEICSCARDPACNVGGLAGTTWETVPGVYLRCLIVDSALKSSLLCWYNQSCLVNFLAGYLSTGTSVPQNATVLDDNVTSRFVPSTLIETIVNEMMIEEWNSSVSYTSFYQNCKPAFCSYTYQERSSMVYIITVLIGLLGGLSIVLRLISLFIVKIFIKRTVATASDGPSVASSNIDVVHRKSIYLDIMCTS
jgi:hypothetical protein